MHNHCNLCAILIPDFIPSLTQLQTHFDVSVRNILAGFHPQFVRVCLRKSRRVCAVDSEHIEMNCVLIRLSPSMLLLACVF